VDEHDWLEAFLVIRRSVLLDPYDPDTREAWAESVCRGDAAIELDHLSQLHRGHAREVAEETAKAGLPQVAMPHTHQRTAMNGDGFKLRILRKRGRGKQQSEQRKASHAIASVLP
jgi:hypothetical protein